MKRFLFVIDMQNDFIDGSLGTKEAVEIVPRVREKIESYREYIKESSIDFIREALYKQNLLTFGNVSIEDILHNFGGIFYTKDTHYEETYDETLEGKKLPIKHCIKNTEGWQIEPSIRENINTGLFEEIFLKETFGLNTEDIKTRLERLIDKDSEIEIVGLCTDICVLSNAIILRAMFPNNRIIVDSSCCAGTTVENHMNALNAMKMCQIDVI